MEYIINPVTNTKHFIKSKKGKYILKQYLLTLKGGDNASSYTCILGKPGIDEAPITLDNCNQQYSQNIRLDNFNRASRKLQLLNEGLVNNEGYVSRCKRVKRTNKKGEEYEMCRKIQNTSCKRARRNWEILRRNRDNVFSQLQKDKAEDEQSKENESDFDGRKESESVDESKSKYTKQRTFNINIIQEPNSIGQITLTINSNEPLKKIKERINTEYQAPKIIVDKFYIDRNEYNFDNNLVSSIPKNINTLEIYNFETGKY